MSSLADRYELYWGDLHNHNAVGYAKGSLARSIEVAREHLDFFAFTGHAAWHDMPVMPKDQHMHWVNGFKVHTEHWPKTLEMLRDANDDGFVAYAGYEWHSSGFGDHCVIFPQDNAELFLPDNVDALLDFAEHKGALAIPHHIAYKQGWRGGNWGHFRRSVTPVVEIFSEQGCTFSDRSPYPMLLHSNGGRVTSQTLQYHLQRGLRFGFVASTDDHFGYPGGYGEGLAGVWAESLDRESISEAIRARRTVSVTGDRIRLLFEVNGNPMGSEIPAADELTFDIDVESPDSIDSVELYCGDRAINRYFPADHVTDRNSLPGPVKCRVQYGWGPWSALDLERVCEWDMSLVISGGRFLSLDRCFQSGPFGEEVIDHARQVSDQKIDLHSFTSRRQAYLQDPTKALVLGIEAGPDATLELHLRKPTELSRKIPLADLLHENDVTFTGVFTSESVQIHRLVTPEESCCSVRWEEPRPASGSPDWYHVRVKLHNGHYAWSSPVWVG